jgi:hypothetical protein
MEPPLTQTIKHTHSAATRKPSSFLLGGQRISIKSEVRMYDSYTKKGQKWSFLLMCRSNYLVISFSSNKAFNVITNRTAITRNREAQHTEFAVMVTVLFKPLRLEFLSSVTDVLPRNINPGSITTVFFFFFFSSSSFFVFFSSSASSFLLLYITTWVFLLDFL